MRSTPKRADTANLTLLVADIGGTRARFALYDQDQVQVVREFPTADLDGTSATTILSRAFAAFGTRDVAAICLAIAGPVIDGRTSMTNVNLSFDEREISNELGVPVAVINDMVALGHALNSDPTRIAEEKGEAGRIRSDETRAVVCSGTGLGMVILPTRSNGPGVIPSEGGHARVAAVDAYERELVDAAERELDVQAITWEHFLSGPGLVNLYRAVATLWGTKVELFGPKDITKQGMSISDPVCHRTLETFCAFLGTSCGSLALTVHAIGGVYVGGTVVASLAPMLGDSSFRRRFVGVGAQAEVLQSVPTVFFGEDSLGLDGAAKYAALTFSSAERPNSDSSRSGLLYR